MLPILRSKVFHVGKGCHYGFSKRFYASSSTKGIQGYASLAINPRPIDNETLDDSALWVRSPYPDVPTLDNITMQELIWSTIGKGKNREQRIALVRN